MTIKGKLEHRARAFLNLRNFRDTHTRVLNIKIASMLR